MTATRPGAPHAEGHAEDLAEAAFADDAERAESAWLFARDSDPGALPPSAQIASDYAEIEDLLGQLPAGPPDESWQDDVLRAAMARPSRPWRRTAAARWAAGGTVLAAAAVVALVVIPRPPPAELEVAIHHATPTRGDSREAAVGDRLIVTARPREAGDLRVFRSDGTVVARCPDGPACRSSARGDYAIDLTLDAPVRYQVILTVGAVDAPERATMDAYLAAAARSAHARVVMYQPIDVH